MPIADLKKSNLPQNVRVVYAKENKTKEHNLEMSFSDKKSKFGIFFAVAFLRFSFVFSAPLFIVSSVCDMLLLFGVFLLFC